MRGGKPIPTYLKIVRGNPGKRKLNAHEPKPTGDLFLAPKWLTDTQEAGWHYAIQHAPNGLLKPLDGGLLAVWVVAEDLHRQAAESLGKRGALLAQGSVKQAIVAPEIAILNSQAQIMIKTAAELGFSPVSRTRIQVLPDPAGRNKFSLLDDM